jgi:hypothetical protein
MAYLKYLKIKLNSLLGDADLYVSFTNPKPSSLDYDLCSKRTTRIDEVIIAEEGMQDMNALDRTIYFNVIGARRTQYEISFEYEYLPSYNELLASSV